MFSVAVPQLSQKIAKLYSKCSSHEARNYSINSMIEIFCSVKQQESNPRLLSFSSVEKLRSLKTPKSEQIEPVSPLTAQLGIFKNSLKDLVMDTRLVKVKESRKK